MFGFFKKKQADARGKVGTGEPLVSAFLVAKLIAHRSTHALPFVFSSRLAVESCR